MAGFAANDSVAKGPVTMRLDQTSIQAGARQRLGALRDAVVALAAGAYAGLERAFAEHLFRGYYREDQITQLSEHLRRNWFSEETGWWPVFQPVAPIYA